MKRLIFSMFAALAAFTFMAGDAFAIAGDIEIRLRDGSKWRGAVGEFVDVKFLEQNIEVSFSGELVKAADLYIIVEGDIAGEIRNKTIFRGDIVAMSAQRDRESGSASGSTPTKRRPSPRETKPADAGKIGVFVLPLEGSVGTSFRKEEIIKIGEKADEFGDGQIIVLLINSNGGSALESQFIAQEIFTLRERHRVVAWVKKAISAGCQTAMCCEEIYFMTEGTAGAVTTWNPGTGESIKGEDLEESMAHLVKIAKRSGHSEHVARSMKTNKALCSYDRDEETGEVTWYGDLSGAHVLSNEDQNLTFTSKSAVHSGFALGVADTEEELAEQLDLPAWYERSEYGREIAANWQKTVETAEEQIPRLIARRGYKNASGTAEQRISTLISINKQLIRWWDRCPNVAQSMLPPKEELERENTQLKKQLADMRRARRGG